MQLQNYFIQGDQLIGQGSQSTVLRCQQNGNSEKICVKTIPHNNMQQLTQINGILLQLKSQPLPHSNVIKILDSIFDNQTLYIFMEECDGDFSSYMKTRSSYWFGIEEIYDFASQIVSGYLYLKSLNIMHRNLIPKNILYKKLFDNRLLYKISNFGVGKLVQGNSALTHAGTPLYQAPEVYANQTYYDDKCDVYSFGLILYQLCYQGQMVSQIRTQLDLQKFHQQIRTERFRCPPGSQADNNLLQLIEQMIVFNPQNRISWYELGAKLQPKFIILQKQNVDTYFVDFTKPLGSGMQGATFQAFHLQTKQTYCAKRIKNDQIEGQREIEIYKKIQQQPIKNDNIIGIEDIVDVGNDAYLILERCDESIEQYCKMKKFDFKEEEIIDIIKQIVNGYVFLKELNIIHRDLKPANILVKYQNQKPILKIIDYGVGKILVDKSILASTQAGTPCYAAPEVLEGAKQYDYSCDIFSLGVMSYELVHTKPLIYATSMDDLMRQLRALQNVPAKCKNNKISGDLRSRIEKMLLYQPERRITWEELKADELFKQKKIKIVSTHPINEQPKYIQQEFNPQTNNMKQQNFQQVDTLMKSQSPDDNLFKAQITSENTQPPYLRGTPHPNALPQQQPPSPIISKESLPNSYLPQSNQLVPQGSNQFSIAGQGQTMKKPVILNTGNIQSQNGMNFQQTAGEKMGFKNQLQNQGSMQPIAFQTNQNFPQDKNSYFTQNQGTNYPTKIDPNQNTPFTNNFPNQKFNPQTNAVISAPNQQFKAPFPQTKAQENQFPQFQGNNFNPQQFNQNFISKQFVPTHGSQPQQGQSFQPPKEQQQPKYQFQTIQSKQQTQFQLNQPNSARTNFYINSSQFPNKQQMASSCYAKPQIASQVTRYLDQYILKLMELTKRSTEQIEPYQNHPDNKIKSFSSGLIHLLLLFRIQCLKDLIKFLQNTRIILQNTEYIQEDEPENKKDEDKKRQLIIDFEGVRDNQLSLRNIKKQFFKDSQESIIQEILRTDQLFDKESSNENFTLVNALQLFCDFLEKFEKELPKDCFNLEFKFQVSQIYYLLKDYEIEQHQSLINHMLRHKQDSEKLEILQRRPKKFFLQ